MEKSIEKKRFKTDAQKEAERLVKSFKDVVRIDHKYDEEPLFDYQKWCARKVCDEQIKICKMFNLDSQRKFISKVKHEILKLIK